MNNKLRGLDNKYLIDMNREQLFELGMHKLKLLNAGKIDYPEYLQVQRNLDFHNEVIQQYWMRPKRRYN